MAMAAMASTLTAMPAMKIGRVDGPPPRHSGVAEKKDEDACNFNAKGRRSSGALKRVTGAVQIGSSARAPTQGPVTPCAPQVAVGRVSLLRVWIESAGLSGISILARRIPAPWPTAEFEWIAMCAAHAPLRRQAARSNRRCPGSWTTAKGPRSTALAGQLRRRSSAVVNGAPASRVTPRTGRPATCRTARLARGRHWRSWREAGQTAGRRWVPTPAPGRARP